jgi:plastocyanin
MTTSDNENDEAPEAAERAEGTGAEVVPAADRDGGALVPAAAATAVVIPGSPEDPKSHTALLEPVSKDRAEAWRTRVLLPLLLPIASAAAIFFYVVNLSRALLAGGEWGSLVIASILVLVILGVVAWISAHPDLRTGTLAVMVAVLFLFIGATGLTTLGPSEDKNAEASGPSFKPPSGDPVGTVDVTAEANLKVNATNYDTVAGVNQINYLLGGGAHTLVFTDKALTGFELEVSPAQKQDTGKVELAAGTYTIYCTIPGHRAAGMEATVTVTEGSGEAPAGGANSGANPATSGGATTGTTTGTTATTTAK